MALEKKKSRGRKNLTKRQNLRAEAKELVLQNYSPTQVANKLNISYPTALQYIKYWQLYYTKLALNNTHIAEKQATRVEMLQDEIKEVQQRYWQLYKEIEDKKAKEEKAKLDNISKLEKEIKELTLQEKTTTDATIQIKIDKANMALARVKDSEPTSYINTRLDILKSVMSRIESEQRLMSLYSPSKLLSSSYVSVVVLKQVIQIFQGIIADLVPKEKQTYAIDRIKMIGVKALNGKDVIDVEFKELE